MDRPKRGPDRLARFYRAKSTVMRREALAGRTTRSFFTEAGTTSMRRLIEDSVVAFVPPELPLRHGTLHCTHVLAALEANGRFSLGARLEASTPEPAAFVIGFCTNDRRGAWSALVGAINFVADGVATSRTSVGVFHADGASTWLKENYRAVRETGVTFRIMTSNDLAGTPMRALLLTWVATFEGQLVTPHVLALTDDRPDYWGAQLDFQATSAVDPDDRTLSLRGRLIFE